MNNPKISIVLPCYNGADMLDGAIESIIAQTFQNWELIIVNDCSTDNTLEVANSYAAKDKRIRVFSNEKNSKLPATLNHGFREARGEYWTWTSDDNLLLPNMLEVMSKYLDEHPDVGMAVADENKINASGQFLSVSIKPDDIQHLLPLNNFVGAAFMYRREVALIAGEYNENLFLVEDYEYWLRLSFLTKITHIHEMLYSYRYHERSLTATRRKDIAKKLVEMRLTYLDKVQCVLSDKPKQLALFYYRIVDGLQGTTRWRYYWRFAKQLPFAFGVKYLVIHCPHKLLKLKK